MKTINEELFWQIVSSLDWNKTSDDAILKPALKKLVSMSVEDILEFAEISAAKLYDLDGLVYASNIGEDSYQGEDDFFSTDGFLYIRSYVVAKGKDFYYDVLANPENMPKDKDFEMFLYLPNDAIEQKTNESIGIKTKLSYETFSNSKKWKKN